MQRVADFRFRPELVLLLGSFLFAIATASAKEQEFRLEKPEAQRVELMCENNAWKAQPLTRQSNGVWTLKLSLAPGTYAYKFLVDGKDWLLDPANPKRKTVNGVENSAIEIASGSSLPAATPVATPAPTVEIISNPTTAAINPVPGEITTIEVPLSAKRLSEANIARAPRLKGVKITLSVPPDFDSKKSWPIFVVSNTENYDGSDSLPEFKQAANDAGWIILAADPPAGQKDDHANWRDVTNKAALDYLATQWPGAKDWPVACGGMSGGAKNSAAVAGDVARDHHRLIGMLMMGCNQNMATRVYLKSAPANFLGVPIFLSSGKSDTIATPEQHEWVRDSLKGGGFRKVRLETFDGAHTVYPPHVTEALQWFATQGALATPTPHQSELDKFFKKP